MITVTFRAPRQLLRPFFCHVKYCSLQCKELCGRKTRVSSTFNQTRCFPRVYNSQALWDPLFP